VLVPFTLPFVQRGVLEVLLLAVGAGLVGTWIVLRGLAFYSHAVATATFPGLVLAEGLGFAPFLGALGVAVLFALALGAQAGRRSPDYDTVTALVLVGALAGGILLASDVFLSGGEVESLLFGSLLLIDGGDLVIAAGAAVVAIAATAVLGARWTAIGFDPGATRDAGLPAARLDLALLLLIALSAVACLSAVGALLATALLVVPAATTRPWARSLARWRIATVGLAAVEGVAGVWLSAQTNAPPGATIAVLSGAVFALAVIVHLLGPKLARPVALASALLLAALAVSGCATTSTGDGRPQVVATTTQLGDIVRNVGGSAVDVHQILRPNVDPHEFEPRPSDVRETAGADVVFTSGQNLDRWMKDVIDQGGGDPRVVDLGAALPDRVPGEARGAEASRYDPHWWHDPFNVIAAVDAIEAALTRADPGHRAGFARRADAYRRKLRLLDVGIRRCMAAVPPNERKLVTDHDAFNYFARRYGIRVVGAVIPSQTTQAQPSAGELAALARVIRRERVKAIFPEQSVNQRTARAIADQTGASARYELYGDTLGPDGSRGHTYLGMEEANADAMARGFTGGRRGCSIAGS
jgi:ABC-type Zn uptake system ZnuABC Zn-binding protein ZnuA/ABC-type Mn2+/Zn2+ transport system permease subunit